MRIRFKGFSVVELLIAISIIGILVSVGVINTIDTKARARDASRKGTVDEYYAAAVLYRNSRGTTFIYSSKQGGCDGAGACTDADANFNAANQVTWSQHQFMSCSTGPGCVGFHGGGWGKMTRRNINGSVPNYTQLSVADALVLDGFLANIKTDPRTNSLTQDAPGAPSQFNDFIYTICDSASNPPLKPSQAVEFAIFANLERPQPKDVADARHHCGGPDTNSGGWKLLASSDSQVQVGPAMALLGVETAKAASNE